MMRLPPGLLRLNDRYKKLSRREKIMVAAALVIAPLMLAETLVVSPLAVRNKRVEDSIAQQSVTLTALQTQLVTLQQQLQADPDAGPKAELAALKADQAQLDGELEKLGTTLVRPEEMNGMLERLLARHTGLRLLSLKTLQPQSVIAEKREPDAAGAPAKPAGRTFDLYRHGVEIRLEGSYSELQAYVTQLEELQQRLVWGSLQYKVTEYPKAEMSLTVYTLSPDRAWLSL